MSCAVSSHDYVEVSCQLSLVVLALPEAEVSGVFLVREHLIRGIMLFRKGLGSGHEVEWKSSAVI